MSALAAGAGLGAPFVQHALLAGTPIAIACGLVGYFLVIRLQVFASDALGHVAYTGALAALAAGLDPRIGLFAATVVVGLLLAGVGRDRFSGSDHGDTGGGVDDVVIGSTFAWVLGLGTFFLSLYATRSTNGNASVSYLFGSIYGLSAHVAVVAAVIAGAVCVAMVAMARPLLFATIDPAVARVDKVAVGLLGIVFLAVTGVCVAEASQVVGALLVLGLMAAPGGAAARLISRPFVALLASAGLAVASLWLGLAFALAVPRIPPSFAIVAVAAMLFALSGLDPRTRSGRRSRDKRRDRELPAAAAERARALPSGSRQPG